MGSGAAKKVVNLLWLDFELCKNQRCLVFQATSGSRINQHAAGRVDERLHRGMLVAAGGDPVEVVRLAPDRDDAKASAA